MSSAGPLGAVDTTPGRDGFRAMESLPLGTRMATRLAPLHFDACERLAAMARALEESGLPPSARVLDVGGHPGLLAAALAGCHAVTTVDFPETGPVPYVRGSGAALPFAAGAFDAVVASDTLEHVPPAQRAAFLVELVRVSSSLVLVGGPYATAGVARAEARLRNLESLVRAAPDRWLAEHAEHGLPELPATLETLRAAGAADATARPDGDLLAWLWLYGARTTLVDLPGGTAALNRFMPRYNLHAGGASGWLAGQPDPAAPEAAYRHLVVASKHGNPGAGGGAASPRVESPTNPPETDRLRAEIDATGDFLEDLARAIRRAESADAADRAYADQIRRALSCGDTPRSSGLIGRISAWVRRQVPAWPSWGR